MAASAVGSNYQVAALDAFGDVDLEALCECHSVRRDFRLPFSAQGLFKASQSLTFDAVAYTANLENHPQVVGDFARRRKVFGNPPEVLARVRHWPILFSVLEKEGFRTPATLYSGEAGSPDSRRKWLVKPVRGGGGQHITFWRNGQRIKRGFMLQEYVPGVACSASFVANGQKAVVIGLTEQLVGRTEFGGRGFCYCGNILPMDAGLANAPEVLDQVQRIASLLTLEFGLVGVNGMDFILTDGQVCPTEINPRYSASMELIERAYGLPIFDLHMRAVLQGELPDFSLPDIGWPAKRTFGKAILYAGKDSRALDTQSWLTRGIRDVPHPGERIARGKPVCTVLADGDTRNGCFSRLVDEAEGLRGEINE